MTQAVLLRQYNKPLFDLFLCKYGFLMKQGRTEVFEFSKEVMPRLSIINKWLVLNDRDQVLRRMAKSFNPRYTVILEKDPNIPYDKPDSGQRAKVSILDSSTDHLTVEAELSHSGVLLLTDSYSEDWTAKPLEGSSQSQYEIIPADYAFMGVPLQAGKHRIRIEYLPTEFVFGKWVSIVSLSLYMAAIIMINFRRRRH